MKLLQRLDAQSEPDDSNENLCSRTSSLQAEA
jgi:hypothetical protein